MVVRVEMTSERSADLSLRPVRVTVANTPLTRRIWARFPKRQIYPRSSLWTAPLDDDMLRLLDPRQNPSLRHSDALPLLARRASGRVVGRLLVHVNHRHNVQHGERVAFFGYFECIDDPNVAEALLDAAAAYGQRHGCTRLRGPFGMTMMQELGIVTDGFDRPPAFDETYSTAYYPLLFEAAGLQPAMRMTTFQLDVKSTCKVHPVAEGAPWVECVGFRVSTRQPDATSLDQDIEFARDILNDSFGTDPNFVPLSSQEWHYQVDSLRRLIDFRLVRVAEIDGVPVGFVLCVPDFGPLLRPMRGHISALGALRLFREAKRMRRAVLTLMCVRRNFQGRGIMRALLLELTEALRSSSYETLTVTWVAEHNAKSLARVTSLGAQPYHHLAVYERVIGPMPPRSAAGT